MQAIKIIYEDNHLIAVNKPSGVLVQADETGDPPLEDWVKKYIKDRYDKPGEVFLGVIHRIDRPVSGLVVFARTSKALIRMNELFKERKVKKTYWAIVNKRPEALKGVLTHFLLKDVEKNITKAYESKGRRTQDAKLSTLEYALVGELGDQFLLEVNPITGRPHQIRAQLSKTGLPIRGDKKYGSKYTNYDGSICLHSKALQFEHPVKKEEIVIQAGLPNTQLWDLFRDLQYRNTKKEDLDIG